MVMNQKTRQPLVDRRYSRQRYAISMKRCSLARWQIEPAEMSPECYQDIQISQRLPNRTRIPLFLPTLPHACRARNPKILLLHCKSFTQRVDSGVSVMMR